MGVLLCEGGSDEKPANGGSYAQESGIGLLGNPVYEAGVSGTHLPLGSPSVEAEYNMDNPLYMMGVPQSSVDDAILSHDYDYALTQDVAPPTSKAPPPPSASGQVYAEPDIGHPLTPNSPHDYSEPSAGTSHPPASGPIYDAPLVSEQRGTPAISHYETADNVLEINNPLLSATHDGDREDV